LIRRRGLIEWSIQKGGNDMERRQSASIVMVFSVIFLMLFGGLVENASAGKEASLPAPIIINHRCADLSKVPAYWIKQAKKKLRIGYSHTSHGSQLVTGIEAFRGKPTSLYYFTSSGWGFQRGVFLNDYWASDHAGDLGGGGDLTWRNATVTMLKTPGNDRNVVMWSWCGGVSENSRAGINAYLKAMNGLEKAYPRVKFIYMTGHLDGTGAAGNLNIRNNQIRAYCRTQKKILFDFADIESYAPGGTVNYMKLMANDNCDYDSNGNGDLDKNWAADWIAANPKDPLAKMAGRCSECAHSQKLNCILKGRAFWWMMARLAGWDGNPVPAR
jgi:hypothetical protein